MNNYKWNFLSDSYKDKKNKKEYNESNKLARETICIPGISPMRTRRTATP